MELLRDTPMTAAVLPEHLGPDRPIALVIVKASFALEHRAIATLADAQPTLHGDTFVGDDPRAASALASDFAPVKATGELLVVGACHPPGGRATISAVAVEVGGIRKAVGVFGERTWKRGLLGAAPSEPAPFEAMPITFDRAFGGPGSRDNPFGRGVERGGALPNLESMQRPIASLDDRPTPTALGPLSPTHPARLRFAGTYDARWRRERFPFWPEDFDVRYFQSAPEDQRRPKGFWTGDEAIALKNLHPTRAFVRSKLPGIVPRAYAQRAEGRPLERFGLALDTIVLDGERMEAVATWRGSIPLVRSSLDELHRVFVFHEPARIATSPAAAAERMKAALIVAQLEAAGFRPRNAQDSGTAATRILKRHAERSGLASPSLAAASALAERTLASATMGSATMVELGVVAAGVGAAVVGAAVAGAADVKAGADAAGTDAAGTDAAGTDAARADAAGTDAAGTDAGAPGPDAASGGADPAAGPSASDAASPELAGVEAPDTDAGADAAVSPDATLADVTGVTVEDARAAFAELGFEMPDEVAAALGAAAPAVPSGGEAMGTQVEALLSQMKDPPSPPDDPDGVRARALTDLGLAADAGPEAFLASIDARLASIAQPDLPTPAELETGLAEVGASSDVRARVLAMVAGLRGDSAQAKPRTTDAAPDTAAADTAAADTAAADTSAADATAPDTAAAPPGADPVGAGAAASSPGAPPAELPMRARIQRDHATGIAFRGDASGADLSGLALGGWQASGAVLARARLEGATLNGAELSNAKLGGADLRGADLGGADLRRADLGNADLSGADLSGATMTDASLDGATLDGAKLAKADLSGASLRGASLIGASAAGASLRGADLSGATLRQIAADGADLTDATLHGADASGAVFTRATLRGLRAKRGACFDGADLRHADAARARFAGSSLRGVRLAFGDLARADFSDADLTEAGMSGCALRGARFDRARLDRSMVTQCDLMSASLRDASLIQTDLRGSSLHAAELLGAETAGALLEGADTSSTKLGGA